MITREGALSLLRKYNQEPFHLQHAFTVEGVLRWYAREVIRQGAEMLGWELDRLFEKTILAMRDCEKTVEQAMEHIGA